MRTYEQSGHWDEAARHYEETAHPFTVQYAQAALARLTLGPNDWVLDVAAGTGALALAAAKTGASVLATDFSAGMIARIEAANVDKIEARVMDGQALDLADASFDAVFSIFGVIMFPDWRKGLSEMARVTRPGGHGVVATWQTRGAATFLLLGEIRAKLFPGREGMSMPDGVLGLSDPANFTRELQAAGYRDPRIETVTYDYSLDAAMLDSPDKLFGMSPDWTSLTDTEKVAVVAEARRLVGDRQILPIPSTALIGVAVR